MGTVRWDRQTTSVLVGSKQSPRTGKGASCCVGAEWLTKIGVEPPWYFPPNRKQSAMQNDGRRCGIEQHQEAPKTSEGRGTREH